MTLIFDLRIYLFIHLFLSMSHISCGLLCPYQPLYEKLDVDRLSKLNATWYDVFDIPYMQMAIDCWDWHTIRPAEGGFSANVTMHVAEKPLEDHLYVFVHFIENRDGTYSLNQEHKKAYATNTKQAVSHKATQQTFEGLDNLNEAIFSSKFFFLTDYENYFIASFCGPDGLGNIVKNRNAHPTAGDILNIWNALSEQGEIPKLDVEFKKICVSRHYTANHGL
uniref:uncharacterized protein LOC120344020 isoform X1 n=1 Tax=Styela clava TaxID=7725 RepID=UPI00193A383C|nr:uncharacterized protein LOC120344020 isoform X1 [Styela clava]